MNETKEIKIVKGLHSLIDIFLFFIVSVIGIIASVSNDVDVIFGLISLVSFFFSVQLTVDFFKRNEEIVLNNHGITWDSNSFISWSDIRSVEMNYSLLRPMAKYLKFETEETTKEISLYGLNMKPKKSKGVLE